MFEDEFTEIQTDMVDICNEYSCGVADKVFVYAANEGLILTQHFYSLNNCLYKCSKLNNAGLQTEFDVSIDCQRQVLKVLNDNVKKIQTLCEKYNQPIPKLMKLVYEPKTKKFNAYNILAIYGIARLCGLKEEETLVGLSNLRAASGRFEPHYLKNGATAIVDYAHTPDALNNVISTINSIRQGGRLITVVGCGGNRDKTKRPEMAAIAQNGSDILILTSDNPRYEEPNDILSDMKAGIKDYANVFCVADRHEAIKLAAGLTQCKQDIILIAGKGHETYQEIKGEKHHFDDREEISKY